jgi:hypothetical protein
VFTEQGEGGGTDYGSYVRSTDGGPAVRLGSGQALDLHPDGTRILSRTVGGQGVLMIYPTGTGETIRIAIPDLVLGNASFTGRGNELVLVGRRNDAPAQGFLYEPSDGELKPITPQGIDLFTLVLNPVQRQVAVGIRGEQALVYSLDGGDPQPLPGIQPHHLVAGWSEDGRILYLAERDTFPLSILRYDRERETIEPFLQLTPPSPAGLIDIGPVYINPSGTAYLYSYRRYLSTLYLGDRF